MPPHAVVQIPGDVPLRVDLLGDTPCLIHREGGAAPIGINNPRDRAGGVVDVGPFATVAAPHEGAFQDRLVIEEDLEQTVVAARMDTSSFVVVFEVERVAAPVSPTDRKSVV